MLWFITTCMGRLEYVKQALPTLVSQPDSKVAFVDWSCPDGSGSWVKENFPQVEVVKVDGREFFNLSAARNAGAIVGRPGDLLCFIDCDVIAEEGLSKELLRKCKPGTFVIFQARGLSTDGFCAVSYDDFEKAGRYDETFRSYGNEDADFHDALRFLGVKEDHIATLIRHIDHPDEIKRPRYELKLASCENQMYRKLKWELARRLGRPLGPERHKLYDVCLSKTRPAVPRPRVDVPKPVKVSLCTTCKGREWQLKAVYKRNIEENVLYGSVEFVLLNYDSPGDVDDYVRSELWKYVESGVLKYYSFKTPGNSTPWNACVAKNMAHRLATGDIVCNVDGDNLIGSNFAQFLVNKMPRPGIGLRLTGRDAGGRIALWKRDFMALGGYDESFLLTGGEDNDLEDRCWLAGIEMTVAKSLPNSILPNTDVDREKFLAGRKYVDLQWENEVRRNRNKQLGRISVNELGFTPATLTMNFSDKVELGPENPEANNGLSDINPLYPPNFESRPMDWKPDGVYYFVHQDWRDPIFFKPNGDFYRPCRDDGKWRCSSGRLFMLWDNWAPESLGRGEDGVIRGNRMRALRLGDWAPAGHDTRLLMPPETWAEIFAPWSGKKVAYLEMFGNVGDLMIYTSALQLMCHFGVKHERWREDSDADVVFMSGGGNLGMSSQVARRQRIEHWASQKGIPWVILPQTIVPGDGELFRPNGTIYARDRITLSRIKGSKFLPDLALGFKASFELPKPIFGRGVFCSKAAAPSPSYSCDPVKLCQTPEGYVALASLFEEVVTNRLHFAIASLIAGRKTTLFPNEYHKNKVMWEDSLKALGCEWTDSIREENISKDDDAARLASFVR